MSAAIDAGAGRAEPPADLEHEQRRARGDDDLGESDDEPAPVERPVEGRQEPRVERLRVGRRARRGGGRRFRSRRASARSGRSSRRTPRGSSARSRRARRGGGGRRGRDERPGRGAAASARDTWRGWLARRNRTQSSHATSRGFSTIASGRAYADVRWTSPRRVRGRGARSAAGRGARRGRGALARACAGAADRGPLGHHTHWTAPDHARPDGDGDPGDAGAAGGRRWLRAEGVGRDALLRRRLVFGLAVAEACAALGYVDCTPRSHRPPHLEGGGAWVELCGPGQDRPTGGGSCSPSRRPIRSASWCASRSRRSRHPERGRARLLPRHGPSRRPPSRRPRRGAARPRAPSRGHSTSMCSPRTLAAAAQRSTGQRRARPERRTPGVESARCRQRRRCHPSVTIRRGAAAAGRRPLLADLPALAGAPGDGRAAHRQRRRARRPRRRSGSRSASISPWCSARSSTASRRLLGLLWREGPGEWLRFLAPDHACSSSGRRASTRRASGGRAWADRLVARRCSPLIVLAFGIGTSYDFSTTGLIPTAVVTCALAIGVLRAAYDSLSLELMRVAGVRRRVVLAGEGESLERLQRELGSSRGGIALRVRRRRLPGRRAGPARARRLARRPPGDARAAAAGRADPGRGRLRRAQVLEVVERAHRQGVQGPARARHDRPARAEGRVRPGHGRPAVRAAAADPDRLGLGAEAAVRPRSSASSLVVLGLPLWLLVAARDQARLARARCSTSTDAWGSASASSGCSSSARWSPDAAEQQDRARAGERGRRRAVQDPRRPARDPRRPRSSGGSRSTRCPQLAQRPPRAR